MKKVVIVEDNSIEADVLEKLVSSIEENLDIAKTGFAEEAFQIAEKEKVCLFIIDLQLNDYSGMELASKIRELDAHKMTPVVFITGNMSRELFAFKTYHCYDYIIKPYNEEQVTRVLKTILVNSKDDESVLRICTRPYTYTIKLVDILYVESINRKINVFTCKDSYPVKGKTLTEVYKELGPDFLKVHNSFIINTTKIFKTNYSKREIFIEGKEKPIPIGKSQLSKAKERLNGVS